jgi:hypothetical protein
MNGDVLGGFNSDPHMLATDLDNGQPDLIPKANPFALFSS